MNTTINTKNKYIVTKNTELSKIKDLAAEKQIVITKIYDTKSHEEFHTLFNTHISLLLKKQGLSFFDNKLPHSFQLALLRKVQVDSDILDIKSLSKIDLNKKFGQHLKKWCINEINNGSNKLDHETLKTLKKISEDCLENPETSAHFEIAIKSLEQEHGVNSYFTSYDMILTKTS